MFKKILGTTAVKIVGAIASLIILSLNARVLGPAGLGTISLIVVGIAINQNISSLIGGSAVVYLTPRFDNFHIYTLSSAWGLISSALGTVLLALTRTVPEGQFMNVFLLSLLAAHININQMILLGHQRMQAFNLNSLLQSVVSALTLYGFFHIAGIRSIEGFIYATYLAFGLTFISSFLLIFNNLIIRPFENIVPLVKEALKLGGSIQLAGLLQTLNYRFSYFLLKKYFGAAVLGRFDAGNKLSEGIWLIAKSMALVQYSRISNETDQSKPALITLGLVKLSLIITLAGIIALWVIPSEFFELLLGKEFHDVKTVILVLAPGIMAIASGMIFSHYFSGTGRPHFNTLGSAIGLISLIILGYLLIPAYGLIGTGIATSASYLISLVYQLMAFHKISGTSWRSLVISVDDLNLVREILRRKN
ncbi:MAG: polysaccharide biosynthesis C-terminal domain-containing protein [Bacteroidales bacterium]